MIRFQAVLSIAMVASTSQDALDTECRKIEYHRDDSI